MTIRAIVTDIEGTTSSIDFVHDVTPTSLSADTIHLNTAGYTIVAGAVQQFLTDKSW